MPQELPTFGEGSGRADGKSPKPNIRVRKVFCRSREVASPLTGLREMDILHDESQAEWVSRARVMSTSH
jgi:hypothetical protein